MILHDKQQYHCLFAVNKKAIGNVLKKNKKIKEVLLRNNTEGSENTTTKKEPESYFASFLTSFLFSPF